MGYNRLEQPVGQQSRVNVVLIAEQKEMGEVVVVGYDEQKKLTVTGAIATVSGSDLVKAPVAGISNALIGWSRDYRLCKHRANLAMIRPRFYPGDGGSERRRPQPPDPY